MEGDRMKNYLFSLFLCFCFGCTSISTGIGEKEIAPESIQKISIGKTTKPEIIALFGNPHSISTTATGQEVYKYVFMKSESKSSPSIFSVKMDVQVKYQELNIMFKDDIVVDYTSTRR